MKLKLLVGACVLFISSLVYAECPKDLNVEKMVECLTIEGSGENYQDWLVEFNQADTTETTTATASTISPITGSDIRNIKPASGR